RDRDLAALGNSVGDGAEKRVEDTGDGGLALASSACDARDELGLGDGLVSHVILQRQSVASIVVQAADASRWSSDRLECINHHPHSRVISRVLGFFSACRGAEVTIVTRVTTFSRSS